MRRFFFGFAICLFAAGAASAADEFLPAIRIEAKGEPIDVGGYRGGAPCVADFDGDGLNDLFVGQEGGKIRVYRNLGTQKEPRFGDFEWLRTGDRIDEVAVAGLFRPQLVDLEGNGGLDLVAASNSGMMLRFRRGPDSRFAEPEILKHPNGSALRAGFDPAYHVVDWDGDADNDLIFSGRGEGQPAVTKVWLAENKGESRAPAWSAPVPLEAAGEPIQVGPLSDCPLVADWNGDGKLDLLVGSRDGSLLLFENVGEVRAPRLAKSRMLVPAVRPMRGAGDTNVRGMGGNFWVTDWDGDGRLDLLVGDNQTETLPPELPDAAEQLDRTRQEAGEILTDYRRLRGLANRLAREPDGKGKEFVQQSREKQLKRLEELQTEIARLEQGMQPRQVRHGYIWLLRRATTP